jgi:hypothetical protein
MSIIQSSASQILYALPSGKPNSAIECTKENVLSRPRVFQPAQKGPTCWYYALNMIRVRIGKHPSEDYRADREIEIILSQRRKLITATRDEQSDDQAIVSQLIEDHSYTHLKLWTIEGAQKSLPRLKELSRIKDPEAKAEAIKVLSVLKDFSQQDEISNLRDYINFSHAETLNKINQMFLTKLGKTPESYFEEDQRIDSESWLAEMRRWEDVKGQEKRTLLENYIFRSSYEGYRLKVSKWHPEEGPERLVQVLKENGPMYAKGQVGFMYYETPPKVVNKIASTSIFGWQKGAARKELKIFHSIVVVGAASDGQGLVYYVDPLDESKPDTERTIYVTSYVNFINRLGDLRNRYLLSADGKSAVFTRDCGYGLHSP